MKNYAFIRITASRLFGSLVAIAGASIVAFTLLRITPGDPARLYLGEFASQEAVDALRNSMGLDDPLPRQYITYMTDFFTGDWGFSYNTGEAVTSQLAARLPATIELGLFAFMFAVVGALALAIIGTYRHRPVVDRVAVSLAYLGLGVPPFWFALVLLIVFYQNLGWFPGPVGRLDVDALPPPPVTGLYTVDSLIAGEWGIFASSLWHLALPTIALGFLSMAFLMRLLRANLLDVSREPFLVVVRSKGIGRFVTFRRHALPNAILPTLTYGGLLLAQLLGGSVLVEKVFNWPGVGALVTDSITRQDFGVVQAFILLSAFVYVVINFTVDTLYGVLDPRVREGRAIQ
jgi:ABC-type dipeptide/oligopeptide/nickel transport system permease component